MKSKHCEMIFILDRSGSMSCMGTEPVNGFNRLIEDQRKPELGTADVTLVLFDDKIDFIYDKVNINNVRDLEYGKEEGMYYPRGFTSLYDAIGITFEKVGKRLAETPEEERPSKVMVNIFTDGAENNSKEYSSTVIRKMIKEQEDKYSWLIEFTGTTAGALKEASNIGINLNNVRSYENNSRGMTDFYSETSVRYCSSRV